MGKKNKAMKEGQQEKVGKERDKEKRRGKKGEHESGQIK